MGLYGLYVNRVFVCLWGFVYLLFKERARAKAQSWVRGCGKGMEGVRRDQKTLHNNIIEKWFLSI